MEKWIAHVRTALPDLRNIELVERPEDRHRYLMVEYKSGLKVPSWLVSDGTLRLFALTLLPYLHNFDATVLIEEPENGIHPKAIETVYQSLSSVREHQVLMATHSPTILSVAKPKDILCFSKSDEGETLVVKGDQHPALKDWHDEVNLSVLYAGGVLG